MKKTIDESDLPQIIAEKDTFNCSSCLLSPKTSSKKVKTTDESLKINPLECAIVKNITNPLTSKAIVASVNETMDVDFCVETNTDYNLAIEYHQSKSVDKENNPETSKAVASANVTMDIDFDVEENTYNNIAIKYQQSESSNKDINMETPQDSGINLPQCQSCQELKEVKNNLEQQLMDSVNNNANNVTILEEKVKEIERLKSQVNDNNKDKTDDKSETLNVDRLRKMYNNAVKDKQKLEESHSKSITELEKARKIAEEELRITTKKQKDALDEKNTLLKILDCMTKLYKKQGIDLPKINDIGVDNHEADNPKEIQRNLGAVKKFSCSQCTYQGDNMMRLKQHKQDKHLLNVNVNYPCDLCDHNTKSIKELREHKQAKHIKVLNCSS